MSKWRLTAGVMLLSAFGLAACGSSSSSSSSSGSSAQSTLRLSIAETGHTASFSGPATATGGVVRVTLQNQGKTPHSAQFIRVQGSHTTAQAYKQVTGNSNKTPAWMRAAGGVSTTMPGASNTATVLLAPGKYLVTEVGGPQSSGPPAKRDLIVTSGPSGGLPSAAANITAATTGKDKYHWQISGLHAGQNQLTFKSEGTQAIHLVAALKLKPGQNPSLAEIQKSFAANGPPPSSVDLSTYQSTGILDGGKSQVTTLNLQPGTYVFFCPLSDRDGGKLHTAEGLLTKYTVK